LPGGSFARVLRTRALRTRRLPRTASLPPAAIGPPPQRPANAGEKYRASNVGYDNKVDTSAGLSLALLSGQYLWFQPLHSILISAMACAALLMGTA
jgi:hypothetical protein